MCGGPSWIRAPGAAAVCARQVGGAAPGLGGVYSSTQSGGIRVHSSTQCVCARERDSLWRAGVQKRYRANSLTRRGLARTHGEACCVFATATVWLRNGLILTSQPLTCWHVWCMCAQRRCSVNHQARLDAMADAETLRLYLSDPVHGSDGRISVIARYACVVEAVNYGQKSPHMAARAAFRAVPGWIVGVRRTRVGSVAGRPGRIGRYCVAWTWRT